MYAFWYSKKITFSCRIGWFSNQSPFVLVLLLLVMQVLTHPWSVKLRKEERIRKHKKSSWLTHSTQMKMESHITYPTSHNDGIFIRKFSHGSPHGFSRLIQVMKGRWWKNVSEIILCVNNTTTTRCTPHLPRFLHRGPTTNSKEFQSIFHFSRQARQFIKTAMVILHITSSIAKLWYDE